MSKFTQHPKNTELSCSSLKNKKKILEIKGQKEIEETKEKLQIWLFSQKLSFRHASFHSCIGNNNYNINSNINDVWGTNLKALVENIALQHTKGIGAADKTDRYCICQTNWYIIGKLLIIQLGIIYLVTNKIKKSSLFKGHLFSNMTNVMLSISNTRSYVPIKLCKIAGSIHLFRIRGRLTMEHVRFKRNWIWDVLEIDW